MTEHDMATESNDWSDRLIDQGLQEVVGGDTPPDLSSTILAAHEERLVSPGPEVASGVTLKQRFGWARWAAAASVSFLAGTLVATAYHSQQTGGTVVRVDEPLMDNLSADATGTFGQDPSSTHQSLQRSGVLVQGIAPGEQLPTIELSAGEVEGRATDGPAALPAASASTGGRDSLGYASEPPVAYPNASDWKRLTTRQKQMEEADSNRKRSRGSESLAETPIVEAVLEPSPGPPTSGATPQGDKWAGYSGAALPTAPGGKNQSSKRYVVPAKDRPEGRSARSYFAGGGHDAAREPARGLSTGLAMLSDEQQARSSGAAADPVASMRGRAVPQQQSSAAGPTDGYADQSIIALGGSARFDNFGLDLGSEGRAEGDKPGESQPGAADLPQFSSDLDVPFRGEELGRSAARTVLTREEAAIRQLTELHAQTTKALKKSGAANENTTPADTNYRRQILAYWDYSEAIEAGQQPALRGGEKKPATVSGWELREIERKVVDKLSDEIVLRRTRLDRALKRLREVEAAEGQGPGAGGDKYTAIHENPFVATRGEGALSTFSIDVDTASYANVRQFLNSGRMPPPDAVRLEELINYFDYGYAGPADADASSEDTPVAESPGETAPSSSPSPQGEAGQAPFAAHVEVAGCPWTPAHRLVRIGVKGREIDREKRPLTNLVFLVDVSGSMNNPQKHPLVIEGLKALAKQLGENDRVAIVVYASREGLALPSITGSDQETILAALDNLRAGGSTAGGAGIRLAYQVAEDHFIQGGVNRVILCTDGDFNVGTTSTAELERLVTQKAKETGVFLSVCGFGRGNLNDAMMETISGKGNGNYYYIDSQDEAEKVFVKGLTGTLVTIAKDVKIQVEFNPAKVAGYRLLGYENRMLRAQDFNDDKKDAGEIGAGHTVTALYELVPAGEQAPAPAVDELKYQRTAGLTPEAAASDETLTLKMRYKQPDGDVSSKLQWPITDTGKAFGEASADLQFAASVASFGMQLRGSKHAGDATLDAVLEIAQATLTDDENGDTPSDPNGYRAEFVELVNKAKQLSGE